MASTNVKELEEQVKKFWSPIFVPELKESALLPNLINTDFTSTIQQFGDTAYVSMIEAAEGDRKQKNVDGSHTVIKSEKLKTNRVGIVADQIFSAAFELDSLVDLQSQLGSPEGQSAIRNALLKGVELKINEYIYSLVSPSTSNPDHSRDGVGDYNFSQLQTDRALASQAKWPGRGQDWYALLDPSYYNDFMNDQKNSSSDYVGQDLPIVGQQKPYMRSGFMIFEDNSAAMNQISPTEATSDLALLFHRDFCYMVAQSQPEFYLVDLKSNKQRGYLLGVDLIGGAKLGLEGSVKHIKVYNS